MNNTIVLAKSDVPVIAPVLDTDSLTRLLLPIQGVSHRINMAEIEISILSRQCLGPFIPTKEQMTMEAAVWEQQLNQAHATVDWQFTAADAHIKLKKLYSAF